LVLLTPTAFERLATIVPTAIRSTNALSARALKEYRKTAAAVADAPWHLKDAQEYLLDWCADNENGHGELPVIGSSVRDPCACRWVVV
jgi:hypothetical protein